MLACGGSKGEIAIWDISENLNIENHFKGSLIEGSYSKEDYDPDAKYEEVVEGAEDDGFESMDDDEDNGIVLGHVEAKKKEKKDKKEKKEKKKSKK